MEQNTQVAGGDTQNAGGIPGQDVDNGNAGEDRQLSYDTYQRTVTQAKKAKQELEMARQEMETLRQEKLEAEGKKDELITTLKKQVGDLDSKYRQSQAAYTWNVVGAQIEAALAAKGVRNPRKALEFAKAVHKDELTTIAVDDNYNVDGGDLNRFVDNFLNNNKDMGFVGSSNVADITPGVTEGNDNNNVKGLSDLSDEDIARAWKNLKR